MAKKYQNSYHIAIFACCREIYNDTKLGGGYGGTKEQIEKQPKAEEDALRQAVGP